MKTEEIQEKIKAALEELGWSHNQFTDEYDKYLRYQSGLEHETFKKQLQRPTTKPKKLQPYLDFIYQHEKWKQLGRIKPAFIPCDKLEENIIKSMTEISIKITDELLSGED